MVMVHWFWPEGGFLQFNLYTSIATSPIPPAIHPNHKPAWSYSILVPQQHDICIIWQTAPSDTVLCKDPTVYTLIIICILLLSSYNYSLQLYNFTDSLPAYLVSVICISQFGLDILHYLTTHSHGASFPKSSILSMIVVTCCLYLNKKRLTSECES